MQLALPVPFLFTLSMMPRMGALLPTRLLAFLTGFITEDTLVTLSDTHSCT